MAKDSVNDSYFRKKINSTLLSLARFVDKLPNDTKELYHNELKIAIQNCCDIFITAHGFNGYGVKDGDLIFDEGTMGLQNLANKYVIRIGDITPDASAMTPERRFCPECKQEISEK